MTRFFKVSGGGNDFLALVEPAHSPSAEQIRSWCARRQSMGADGLFLLQRTPRGARMTHFNADGSDVSLCLNGTRCAARLAFHLGWSSRDKELEIDTGAGAIEAHFEEKASVRLRLSRPEQKPLALTLGVDESSHQGWSVLVGVPHFVLLWPESLEHAPIARLGTQLRSHHDLGPAGANIDFVRFPDRHCLEIRSYERGVEGETLACGTGVLAAAAVGLELGRVELPVEALTLGGFRFQVAASPSSPQSWELSGDARLIASGELRQDAELLPVPPRWSS